MLWGALQSLREPEPVETLIDYIKSGESIDNFLDGFPTVTREQVIAFLEEAQQPMVKLVA